jgi:cytochrome-b5 reductase
MATTRLLTRPAVWTAATAAFGLTIAVSAYNHEARTAHADAPSGPATVNFSSFTTLKLESAEMVNHNVKRLRFALPNPSATTNLSVVSSLLTRHTPTGSWIPVFRPYTPVSSGTSDPGHVTFMVKLYPNGKASGKMHSLVPGDEMTFKQLQEFKYTPNEFSAMTFIAGGSGITPIYQLTRAILGNPSDGTKVRLVYANNTPEDILLKSEFDAMSKEFPGRFAVTYLVGKGEGEGSGLKKGFVTKELLGEVMPKLEGEKNVKVLVSGPPAMTAAVAGKKGGFGWTQGGMRGILAELGYTKEQVHKF